MDFHRVELRCLVNASEDPAKVRRALACACGLYEGRFDKASPGETEVATMLERACLETSRAEGQFGNPIEILMCRISKARDVRTWWATMAREAGSALDTLAAEVEERLDDELVLHFRLDKQEAYNGRLLLGRGGDTIAVRCKPKVFSGGRPGAVKAMEEYLRSLGP
jgi:RNA binding exosome subunit